MTDSEQAPPLIPCRRVAIFLSAFAPTNVSGLEATIPERQISFGDLGAVGVLVDRAWRWYHPAWASISYSEMPYPGIPSDVTWHPQRADLRAQLGVPPFPPRGVNCSSS